MVVLPQIFVFNIQILRSDKRPFSFFLDIVSLFPYIRRIRSFIPIVFITKDEPCFSVYQSIQMIFCIFANDTDVHRKLGGVAFDKMGLSRGQRRG